MREYRDEDKVVFRASGGLTEVGSKNDLNLIHRGKLYKMDSGQSIPAQEEELTPSVHFPQNHWIFAAGLKTEAIFLSHGHLDHIGGTPWLYDAFGNKKLNDVRPPVMGSSYTLKVLELQEETQTDLEDLAFNLSANQYSDAVTAGSTRRVGDAEFEFFSVPHSIPGAMGCVANLGGKRFMYLGDTKLQGYDGESRQFKSVLASAKPDVLFLDATGVDREGSSPPDCVAVDGVRRIINSANSGRVFITLFSSHTGRIKQLMECVRKDHPGRQIVVSGKSLYQHLEIAGIKSGRDYTSYSYPYDANIEEDAVIFMTGSNGEEYSAMWRMVRGLVNGLKPREQDTVVFAASTIPVPDNQASVTELLGLINKGTIHVSQDVYLDPGLSKDVSVSRCHTSGHAFQDDLKEIVELANPRILVPVHADRLRRQAMAHMFEERKVLLPDTGENVVF